MKIIISLINFNNAEKTLLCLRSLNTLNKTGIDIEIIVIDNASHENLSITPNDYSHIIVKVIRNTENKGFSGGHNQAIQYARDNNASYLVILNNDTTVHKDLIKEMLSVFEEKKDAGIIGPKIYFTKGSEFHKDRYAKDELGKVLWYAGGHMNWNNILGNHIGVDEVDHGQYDQLKPTEFASGCCMMIKREVIEKIGMLDIRYFLYYEDSDYNVRARKAGFGIYFAPKAILWHDNASSTGGSGSDLQDYFISRNRMLFGLLYAPSRTKFALIRESFRILKTGRPWQKKGITDFYLQKFGKGRYPV